MAAQTRDTTEPTAPAGSGELAGARNMQQLVQLRWIAIAGQLATILFVRAVMRIPLPLAPMLLVIAAQAAFNVLSWLHWRRREEAGALAPLLSLLFDVACLTALLHYTGGITNPFLILYLLQVGLGTALLGARGAWLIAALACVGVVSLALYPGPVRIHPNFADGLYDHYVQGVLLCFVLVTVLLVGFITRINRTLRERDARLATLRQRAVEEEHIVRIGLLASGAAHELGTPLSTLAVILGDWRHSPHFASDPELLQDVTEMQAQVLRCKAIVTNVLLRAGETRGEAPQTTTLREFTEQVFAEWKRSRKPRDCEYHWRFGDDVAIVSDTGLKQMLRNVLDNALEASPDWVALEVARDADAVVLRVRDRGPGFAGEVLEKLGQPYNSTKGKPGGGLGLFLAHNVIRTLGGGIHAQNDPRGTMVAITLPLSVLRLEDEDGR